MEPEMELEKRKRFIIQVLYVFLIGFIIYVVLKFGLSYLAPFVIAFLFATILNKPIQFLNKKCRVNRTLAAVVLVLLFFSLIGFLFTFAGIRFSVFIQELFQTLPQLYTKEIEPALMQTLDSLELSVSKLDSATTETLNEIAVNLVKSLGEGITGISMKVIGGISNWATTLPGFLIRVLFTVISTFFIAIDYDKVTGFLMKQLKEERRALVVEIKDYMLNTLFKCIRSYALIMFITFTELALGLSILRVENAVMIAMIIAVFDILPVLGTGGIMIPWTLITAVQGNYPLAAGLLCVYLVITVIRNILEPKIVGSQVGLHPLLTLISMFAGAQLFGVLGLFGFPITLSLLKNLNDKGRIHLFK